MRAPREKEVSYSATREVGGKGEPKKVPAERLWQEKIRSATCTYHGKMFC